MLIKDPLGRFFYKLMISKKPKVKDGDNALFIWACKYYAGHAFFKLNSKYYDFWRWSTKYYPFSLLFQDRLFHHKNQFVNNFMIRLENLIKKAKLKTRILSGEYGEQFNEFYGTFHNKSDKTQGNIEKIGSLLQKEFGTIYTRENKNGFKILVPTQMLEELENS